MTLDLGPTAPTTGFPACRDSLRKLLTDASNPGAVRLIAINPTLRAETEELLPVLHERSAPDRDGLLHLLIAKVETYPGPTRAYSGWAITFGAYLDKLADLPVAAVVDAFDRWARKELHKDPARHEFYPKPDELVVLAAPLTLELKTALYRARKALEQVAATGPRDSTPESRAEVARMAQEAAVALKASSSRAMPHAPVPAKPDAPMTPLARELIAAGMKNVAPPTTDEDPGPVL